MESSPSKHSTRISWLHTFREMTLIEEGKHSHTVALDIHCKLYGGKSQTSRDFNLVSVDENSISDEQ